MCVHCATAIAPPARPAPVVLVQPLMAKVHVRSRQDGTGPFLGVVVMVVGSRRGGLNIRVSASAAAFPEGDLPAIMRRGDG
jgi:hypothetical protein